MEEKDLDVLDEAFDFLIKQTKYMNEMSKIIFDNIDYISLKTYIDDNKNQMVSFSSPSGSKYVYDKVLDCTIRLGMNDEITVYTDRLNKDNKENYLPTLFGTVITFQPNGLINKQDLIC